MRGCPPHFAKSDGCPTDLVWRSPSPSRPDRGCYTAMIIPGRTRAFAVRLTADGMAWITPLATPLPHRLAGRPADVVIGILRASGRRTAASWFRGPNRIGFSWRFPLRGRSAVTWAGWPRMQGKSRDSEPPNESANRMSCCRQSWAGVPIQFGSPVGHEPTVALRASVRRRRISFFEATAVPSLGSSYTPRQDPAGGPVH